MSSYQPNKSPERFKTHSNYLRAFNWIVPKNSTSSDLEALRIAYKAVPMLKGNCTDVDGALNSLQMAWRTELLLDFTAASFTDDEMIRVGNHWAIVQLYYIFYHAIQALAQANGQPRTPNHPQTQKLFKACWADRNINLAPWSLARASETMRNWPSTLPLVDVHVWASCDDKTAWLLAAKALRTTRDYSVNEALKSARKEKKNSRRKEWKAKNAERALKGQNARVEPKFPLPRLSMLERTDVEDKVRATTIMDYLYRLRIGTNYQDSATFIEGPKEPIESISVREDLRQLGASTLLIHELAVADALGSNFVFEQAKAFLNSTASPAIQSQLKSRLHLIKAHRA